MSEGPMSEGRIRFVTAFETHFRSVYVYCRRRLSVEQVDDAVAETFLVAWRKADQIPPDGEVLVWLYGIAHRVILHQWRGWYRRRRIGDRMASLSVDLPDMPDEFLVAGDESRRVLDAVSSLKEKDQEILRLRLWEELSHAEIAAVLGLGADAVRQRYSRALKSLTREFNRMETKRSRPPAAQKGGAW